MTAIKPATDEQIATLEKLGNSKAFSSLAVRSLIARIRAEAEWQPIETAPKDGTRIDIWAINHSLFNKPGSRIIDAYWGRVSDWMGRERDDWVGAASEHIEPTHWRPLPAPPALSKGDQS